jgi:molybdenum cofactor biosynthesis protein B
VTSGQSAGEKPLKIGILTASDTRTPATDGSGRWIRERLSVAGHEIVDHRISRDDPGEIEAALLDQLALGVDAIVVTGGTGISPRDQVPEAMERICSRLLPGFGEIFRRLSFDEIGPRAMSSRAVAGVRGPCVLFALPGSTAACRLGVERLILPELIHLNTMVRGLDHEVSG